MDFFSVSIINNVFFVKYKFSDLYFIEYLFSEFEFIKYYFKFDTIRRIATQIRVTQCNVVKNAFFFAKHFTFKQ